MNVISREALEVLPDVQGTNFNGAPSSLNEHLDEGRYTLVWWHPQTLSPVACKTCQGGASPEPIRLLMDIYSSGCDVVGLSYESPERTTRYLQDIGMEYPILTVDEAAARAHRVAKAEGEDWQGIPHRVAFLVGPEGKIINRYRVGDATAFLRQVRDDVKNGLPPSKWEAPKRKKFLGLF